MKMLFYVANLNNCKHGDFAQFVKTAMLCIHCDVTGVGTGTEESLPRCSLALASDTKLCSWICSQIQTPLNQMWLHIKKNYCLIHVWCCTGPVLYRSGFAL